MEGSCAAVLSFEQVGRLAEILEEQVRIQGRGNFPTLEVKLRNLVTLVLSNLRKDGLNIRDVRLNGGAASHVLANAPYNDLDLIFGLELSGARDLDRVKNAVLGSLVELLPPGVSRSRITPCCMKEAYVGKMVKVDRDGDRWSLISLGYSPGVELKFVHAMKRPFEFSVDSFQIVLDSLLLFRECGGPEVSENFYPTVVGESVYGDFQECLYHLKKKLIATRHPEEIRGGGLLKYCNLLVRGYKAADADKIKILERYMCSRFFIDFPDLSMQRSKLEAYLANHFAEEESLKYKYLTILYSVVEESTVCLMFHEYRQTLCLIEGLALAVLAEEQGRLFNPHHTFYNNAAAAAFYYHPLPPPYLDPSQSPYMTCTS